MVGGYAQPGGLKNFQIKLENVFSVLVAGVVCCSSAAGKPQNLVKSVASRRKDALFTKMNCLSVSLAASKSFVC